MKGVMKPSVSPASASAPSAEVNGHDPDAIRVFVTGVLDKWDVPGAAVAVVGPGVHSYVEGFGVRKRGTREKVTSATVFGVGSLSKAFTAAALGILVDDGGLHWDDPVVDRLPGFSLADPYLSRLVTIRDLLAHRIGWEEDYWIHFAHRHSLSRADIVRGLRFAESRGFRDRYVYSNMFYVAAGQIVEALTGINWDRFVTERLFAPLGMRSSSTRAADLLAAPDHATSHFRSLSDQLCVDSIRPDLWWTMDNHGPSGSVNMTALDLVPWMRFWLARGRHVDHQILSEAAVREMFQPCMLTNRESDEDSVIEEIGYGLGWLICRYRNYRMVCHSGAFRGMSAYVALVPSFKLGVAVMANARDSVIGGLTTALGHWLLDHHMGFRPRNWPAEHHVRLESEWARRRAAASLRLTKRIANTSPSLPLQAYTGRYQNPALAVWDVAHENGKLWIYRPPYRAKLDHWHLETFRSTWNDPLTDYWPSEFASFSSSPDGRVGSMTLSHDLDLPGTLFSKIPSRDAP
jgi:CubicO group peptidase (beta-lactamase class C family)